MQWELDYMKYYHLPCILRQLSFVSVVIKWQSINLCACSSAVESAIRTDMKTTCMISVLNQQKIQHLQVTINSSNAHCVQASAKTRTKQIHLS